MNKTNDNSLNEAISEKMGAQIPDIVKKKFNRYFFEMHYPFGEEKAPTPFEEGVFFWQNLFSNRKKFFKTQKIIFFVKTKVFRPANANFKRCKTVDFQNPKKKTNSIKIPPTHTPNGDFFLEKGKRKGKYLF